MIHVLLVEDNDSDAGLSQNVLDNSVRETFTCTRVQNLHDAYEMYKGHLPTFDVVLLDLGLAESQGIETLHNWFKEIGRQIPVVVLSGLGDVTVRMEALHLGAQDYIMKDEMILGILCRSIAYAIERHKLSEEHLKRSRMELDSAREKLIEIAASLHNIFASS